MASSSRTLLLLFISSFLFGHSSPLTEYQTKGIDIANPELHFTPSNKNGDIYCERVRVSGVSMANIRSFANSYRVAVTPSVAIPERLHTKIEVCFHRNATRGYCKCGKDEWKGIHKGQWMSVMSPFEDRFVDVKVLGGTGAMTVSVKEDFHEWRVYCLVVGFLLLLIAPVISGWVPFYYSSSMVVGILLVVLALLFQVGLGSYLVHYFSMLINSILVSFGLSEDMYNPQRSATKVTFPLVWTNTCCSHPLYRDSELIEENYLGVRNAAQRKLFDELGVPAEDLPVDKFIPLGRILYKAPSDGKWGEHELDYLLFIVRDVKFNPNPNEVADAKYVNREQLKEILRKVDAGEDGVKLSPWFKLVVENFLFKWWDHVEQQTIKEVADMKTIHKLT